VGFGENKISPLEIADARQAAFRASEVQRNASRTLAENERAYRKALSNRIVELKAEGTAVTVAKDIAVGERDIAQLRYERDIAAGMLEAVRQEAFRRAADRRDLDTLLNWSMRRDLRVDTEPANWGRQKTHGQGEAA
jgi:hypothetical protein